MHGLMSVKVMLCSTKLQYCKSCKTKIPKFTLKDREKGLGNCIKMKQYLKTQTRKYDPEQRKR
jgi:hypothetical protein